MDKRHREEFEKVERGLVSESEFKEALGVLLGGQTGVKFENREPTRKELEARFKLERKD